MKHNLSEHTKCPAKIRIGTRASKLAVAQATEVKNRLLGAFSELTQNQIEIVKIVTTGDREQDVSLAEIGGKGLFTKEIEDGLNDGSIDIAVHSMKDMPAELPEGMKIDCILEREDPRDAFISLKVQDVAGLPQGAVIGTSSIRRQSQILAHRPDLKVVPFRGNVQTRLKKLEDGEVDATFLAVAGLKRLDMPDAITAVMDEKVMLPAVAQGAIGVEYLKSNTHLVGVLNAINHEASRVCVMAERAFLTALGGDCTTPMGCLATLDEEKQVIHLRALLAAEDGKTILFAERKGAVLEAEALGADAGAQLKQEGKDILTWG
jgi:hydroxymethylbilane synthase